ncbi:tetratricopeptide repeat protein [Arundinibacter roseus]|uniref:Tetratricopeptide repeat protein n=1 Tax=Arundinibacter roseus TaxID=2070510 RepID=A0A4R4KBH8_9BACT|nr:tetratricopeptide repeat protein [Arundinibacter roseus]TDB65118.1 tetratricopeptide repeat protein [Arundinibacter roseus]
MLPIRYFLYFLLILSLSSTPAKAQLLNDRPTLLLIQKGIDHIYNYEFSQAQAVNHQVQVKYPNHPVTYFMRAFQMYWQYLPIKDNKAKVGEYIGVLNQCLAAVEKQYGKNSKNPEAVFFTMAARGYIALMYNYQGELLKAANEAQKTYGFMTEGLKLTAKNPEFYFTTGMYNYYVVKYPEDHSIVKPLMIFFKNGNKALGLKQLDIATKSGIVTRVEAAYFLAHIYLEHESRPDLAVPYTTRLNTMFPNNAIFRMIHIESLLLSGKYTEAEEELPELKKRTERFYPISWLVFEGILQEKKYHQDVEAQKKFLAALKIPYDDQYTREYHAMAYAGLARIAHRRGDKAQARKYYDKCLEIAEYDSIEKEAKAYR